jgi:protein MpaA
MSESHDPEQVLRRWRAVARRTGMRVSELGVTGCGPVLGLESRGTDGPWLYLSAGVHGDEAAAVAGLLGWAEQHPDFFREHAVTVVPLFNPAGLAANTRVDELGRDLNRCFHCSDDALMASWRQLIGDRRYAAAVCLHEDYDAAGCYCYELNRNAGLRLADRLLNGVESWLPRDLRRTIDGRRAHRGVIQRRRVPPLPGQPEAVALYEAGVPVTLTFESPSEAAFEQRLMAQAAFVDGVAGWFRRLVRVEVPAGQRGQECHGME